MKRVIYMFLFAVTIGCSPLMQQPDVELPVEYKFDVEGVQCGCPVELRWWESFSDERLNALMEFALRNNRDLAAAMVNVESARKYIRVAKAEFLPSLSFDGEVEAYRINGYTTQEYSVVPTIKWELSLFGALRNSRWGAESDYLSKEWGVRASILSLTTEVAKTLYTLAQYEKSYVIAQQSYELRREATALVDSMHRYGMSDGVALEQARSLVYSARSEVAKYKRAVEQSRLAMNTLLGVTSTEEWSGCSCNSLLSGALPPAIPVGMPSELLERRPDIMESYFNMHSAAAKVGVARASRFPSITLTAEGGFITETLKDLSSAKPFGWSLVGDIVQPIFNFGALKRKEQIAQNSYLASLYDYEQNIIEALSEVEQSLVGISTYRTQLMASKELVLANVKIANSSSALYRCGLGDYLSVIDAERELYSSQIDFVELLAQQYINHIELVKSLGGGY